MRRINCPKCDEREDANGLAATKRRFGPDSATSKRITITRYSNTKSCTAGNVIDCQSYDEWAGNWFDFDCETHLFVVYMIIIHFNCVMFVFIYFVYQLEIRGAQQISWFQQLFNICTH